MKKMIIPLLAMMTCSFANAQKVTDKEVPAVVKSAFQKSYPNAKELKWEKEHGSYEASFELSEKEHSVVMDASGNIMETEEEISIDALPGNVKNYVSKNYAGQKIKEAAKIIDSKGAVTYEAAIKDKDLIFDSKGNFIKEEKD